MKLPKAMKLPNWKKKDDHKVRRMMLWSLGVAASYVVVRNLPDVIRYMKIRMM
jgi:hypothetical protein